MTIKTYSAEDARNQLLDDQYNELADIVCQHGPELLTRGMKPEEANAALLACLKDLLARAERAEQREKEAQAVTKNALNRLQLANRIIDALPEYVLQTEKELDQLVEAFDAPT